MCGSIDSVIGYDYKSVIDRKKKNTSTFVAKNAPYMINALYVEIDLDSKQAVYIERINQNM
jgi:calcineurin-like phosphoesterase